MAIKRRNRNEYQSIHLTAHMHTETLDQIIINPARADDKFGYLTKIRI